MAAHASGDESSESPLGALVARYSARTKGMLVLAVAMVMVFGGVGAVSANVPDWGPDGVPRGAVIGFILAFGGAAVSLLCPFLMGKSLEVRTHGVRHYCWSHKTDLLWTQIDRIDVFDLTGQKAFRVVSIEGGQTKIRLGFLFLGSVDTNGLIESLKTLHRQARREPAPVG
jgi:hypothetical protein